MHLFIYPAFAELDVTNSSRRAMLLFVRCYSPHLCRPFRARHCLATMMCSFVAFRRNLLPRWIARPLNVVDIVAILPYYVALGIPAGGGGLAVVRILRTLTPAVGLSSGVHPPLPRLSSPRPLFSTSPTTHISVRMPFGCRHSHRPTHRHAPLAPTPHSHSVAMPWRLAWGWFTGSWLS